MRRLGPCFGTYPRQVFNLLRLLFETRIEDLISAREEVKQKAEPENEDLQELQDCQQTGSVEDMSTLVRAAFLSAVDREQLRKSFLEKIDEEIAGVKALLQYIEEEDRPAIVNLLSEARTNHKKHVDILTHTVLPLHAEINKWSDEETQKRITIARADLEFFDLLIKIVRSGDFKT